MIFRVLDQSGGPRVGVTVNFSLNTTVGGISVSPATAQSDANGNVQTVVQGGTVATTVRVTATVQGVTPVLSTQSSQLTITTGIPDQDSFSLAVQCPNIEGWSRDGVVVAGYRAPVRSFQQPGSGWHRRYSPDRGRFHRVPVPDCMTLWAPAP